MTTITLDTVDYPVTLRQVRKIECPIRAASTVANWYVNMTMVVKADFGDLGYIDNDWQHVQSQIPFEGILEPDDLLIAVCPAFFMSGISRQETPTLHSDDWGLAIDEIREV